MGVEIVTEAAVGEKDRRRWIALAVIVAAQFMVVLDVAIVNVALPSIKTDLHFSQESLQWVITAYSIFFGGVLLLGGRLMLLVYAMTRATQQGWGTAETIGLLAASAALVAAFFAIELRSQAPLLPLRIFRLRTLSGSNLSGLLMGGAIFSQFFLLTLYMQQVLHYSALKTGVAYIGLTLTIIAFSAVAQALTTRLGVRRVLSAGLAFSTGALLPL